MMITAKPWNPSYYQQNSCALLEQCHENKKIFESSNLLGPQILLEDYNFFVRIFHQ